MHHLKTVAFVVSGIIAAGLASPVAAQKGMGPVKAGAAAGAPAGSAAPPAPVTCSMSGWVQDNNTTNHATDLPNPSGVATPKSVTVYFSPGGSGSRVYPVFWSWGSASAGNPVTVAVSTDKVTLNIFSGAPLHGVWDGSTSSPTWTTYTSGYWRVTICN